MLTVPADQLRRIAREVLEAAGTPADLAAIVGDSLVDANLSGHDYTASCAFPVTSTSCARATFSRRRAPR